MWIHKGVDDGNADSESIVLAGKGNGGGVGNKREAEKRKVLVGNNSITGSIMIMMMTIISG